MQSVIKKAPYENTGLFVSNARGRIEITSFLQEQQERLALQVLAQQLVLLELLVLQQELEQQVLALLLLVLLAQQEQLLLSCHKRPKQLRTRMRSELNFSCFFLLGSRTRRRFKRLF
jgi:hypothetical protein